MKEYQHSRGPKSCIVATWIVVDLCFCIHLVENSKMKIPQLQKTYCPKDSLEECFPAKIRIFFGREEKSVEERI